MRARVELILALSGITLEVGKSFWIGTERSDKLCFQFITGPHLSLASSRAITAQRERICKAEPTLTTGRRSQQPSSKQTKGSGADVYTTWHAVLATKGVL